MQVGDLERLLKDIKGAKKSSNERLARDLGVSAKCMQGWMNGDHAPHPENMERIFAVARQCGLDLSRYLPAVGISLWDTKVSYGENLRRLPAAPPDLAPELAASQAEFLGHVVDVPFGLSASNFTSTLPHLELAARLGNAVNTTKTFRTRPLEAQPHPNIFFLLSDLSINPATLEPHRVPVSALAEPGRDRGAVNRMGIPSPAPESWQAMVRQAIRSHGSGKLLIVSVVGAGSSAVTPAPIGEVVADAVRAVTLAEKAGATVIELNLSCPNTVGGQIFLNNEIAERVCRAARKSLPPSTRLIVKIGYLAEHQVRDFVLATAEHVDGYTAINTLPVEVYQLGQDGAEEPVFQPGVRAGVSGSPIKRLALLCVKSLRKELDKEKLNRAIIGVGGVTTPEDVLNLLDAGANVVQAATVFFSDPLFGLRVREYLSRTRGSQLLTKAARESVAWANWSHAVALARNEGAGEQIEEWALEAFRTWKAENVPVSPILSRPIAVPSVKDFLDMIRELIRRRQ